MGQTQQLPQGKTSPIHEVVSPTKSYYLAQFKTPELAIFSYYLESEGVACLIDPIYDVDIYRKIAKERDAKISKIFLTHYHADYLAGHGEFDIEIVMGPKSKREGSKLNIVEKEDGATVSLGLVQLKVIHTPGHTLESSCFELIDEKNNQVCLFTGDTIFLGEVGRPDLAVSSSVTKEQLAQMLFKSLCKIVRTVKHSVTIFPTHGSGSACGKSIGEGNFCTLQNQMKKNYALQIFKEEQFVQKILSQMPKPPSYFFHDAKLNQTGQFSRYDQLMKVSNKGLNIQEFKSQMDKGCTVIDTRHEIKGSKSIKNSLLMSQKGGIATWIGTILPPDTKILIFCSQNQSHQIIQRLLRIGYFNIKGYNSFPITQWQSSNLATWTPSIIPPSQLPSPRLHLDVRSPAQCKQAGIIQNSKCVPYPEIQSKVAEIKTFANGTGKEGVKLCVNCKTGLRARLAGSILERNGIKAVIVDGKFQDIGAFEGNKVVQVK